MEDDRKNVRQTVIAAFATSSYTASLGEQFNARLYLGNRGNRTRHIHIALLGIPQNWIAQPLERSFRLEANKQLSTSFIIELPEDALSETQFSLVARITDIETANLLATPAVDLIVNKTTVEARMELVVAEEEVIIAPGSTSTIRFKARNQGQQADHIEFSVRGIPASWVSSSLPVIYMDGGEEREVEFKISLPPAPQVRDGQYPVTILATNQNDREQTTEAAFNLIVAAFLAVGRIGVRTESVQFAVAPGSSTTISLTILNQGLEPDGFQLGVSGIPVSWISTTTPLTQLAPGEQKRVNLAIRPPLSPESQAGRRRFSIRVISERIPDEYVEVPCTLTVAAFQKFSSSLSPQQLKSGQVGWLTIRNEGNISQNFAFSWKSQDNALEFTTAPASSETNETQTTANESGSGQAVQAVLPAKLRVSPGQTTSTSFQAKLRQQPFIGRDFTVPFTIDVSSEKEQQSHQGMLAAKPILPYWVTPLFVIVGLILACTLVFLIVQDNSNNQIANETATAVTQATQTVEATLIAGATRVVEATQTASWNQTRAVEVGQEDTDGDGLFNNRELEIGTDPLNPDTDSDLLLDGDEVLNRMTDPLNPDTDNDLLTDGDEVLTRMTNPLNPDTDGDRLLDGDEVQRNTNPLNPDTDGEGLLDGDEVFRWSTNPLSADTDNDRLTDAQEVRECPDPLDPDTDGDSIIDGLDLDPCDPNNPSLTSTAIALIPTETSTPTITPTTEPPPPELTPIPTPPDQLETPEAPVLPGLIAFDSDRNGTEEIYSSIDLQGNDVTRLTTNASQDIQPAWSPDGSQVAFVSNRDGNSEIYVMDANGNNPIRLTNDPGEDLNPTWSPDGDWLAFSSNRDDNEEIYIMQSNGSELSNLTNNPAADREPSWFVDEAGLFSSTDYILFTTDRDGNQEIYRMESDGSDPVNLTNHPATDQSPDGLSTAGDVGISSERRILFASDRGGNMDIYLMDLDGGNPVNLTIDQAFDSQPTWSPNGNWIAFATNRLGDWEIFVLPAEGGNLLNLTNNPAADQAPSWK